VLQKKAFGTMRMLLLFKEHGRVDIKSKWTSFSLFEQIGFGSIEMLFFEIIRYTLRSEGILQAEAEHTVVLLHNIEDSNVGNAEILYLLPRFFY
jgi:hypothetical protein